MLLVPAGLYSAKSGPKCPLVPEIVNENARVVASEYDQPSARDGALYLHQLGFLFTHHYLRLGPDSLHLDVAGGYGIAALQSTIKRGNRAIVVNAQDFWKNFEVTGDMGPKNSWGHTAMSLEVRLDDIDIQIKTKYTAAGKEQHFLDFDGLSGKDKAKVIQRILARYQQQVQSGRFQYRVGFAENILPEIQEKANLITDLYGAYFYSAHRIQLITAYFNLLKPGGAAFIRLKTKRPEADPVSTVITRTGVRVPLEIYLTRKFPDMFELSKEQQRVLIIHRSSRRNFDLSLFLEFVSSSMKTHNTMTVPDIVLREK